MTLKEAYKYTLRALPFGIVVAGVWSILAKETFLEFVARFLGTTVLFLITEWIIRKYRKGRLKYEDNK